MKFRSKSLSTGLLAMAIVSTLTTAAAGIPIRKPSDNGANGNANQWLLLGRTIKAALRKGSTTVVMQREIVCPGVDVEASEPNPTPELSGSCESGNYLFIYQFQSTNTNVTLRFKELGTFVPSESPANYGVILCDTDNSNTLELCTNDPTGGTQVPNITFTAVSAHTVTFTVPNFPTFKSGTPQEGQGLTLFILAHQNGPLGIHFPVPDIQ